MKRIVIILVIFAVIFGLFSAYWFFVQAKINMSFEQTRINMAEEGVFLSNSEPETTGYPLIFSTKVDTLTYEIPGITSIETSDLSLEASSLKPTYWTVESKGKARIKISQNTPMVFDITQDTAKTLFGTSLSGRTKVIKLEARDISVTPVSGLTPPVKSFGVMDVDIRPKDGGFVFDIDLRDLNFNGNVAALLNETFGSYIKQITLSGQAGGLTSLDQNALIAWQDTGTLSIDDSLYLWGPINLETKANLQLSPEGPNGDITLRLGNSSKLLQTLTTKGLIPRKQAMRVALAFKAAPRAEDGKIETVFPVKNGKGLFLGQTVFEIPPFDFTTPDMPQ